MVKISVGVRKNKDGTETPLVMYMDGTLCRELQEVKRVVVKKNFDYVSIITGRVGKGKSTFAKQLAKFFDKSFDLNRVCFSADEFVEVTTNCPQFSSVVLDEAFMDLNTQLSRSPSFLKVLNHLNIIRKRNLFIFICLPDFFDLHQSIALVRSEHLFHIYGEGFGGRGRFLAFGPEAKRMLYINGKKFHDINAWKSNFKGSFTELQTVDWEMYEERKDEFLNKKKILNPMTKIQQRWEARTIMLLLYFHFVEKISQTKLGEIVKESQGEISRIITPYMGMKEKLFGVPTKYQLYFLLNQIREKNGETPFPITSRLIDDDSRIRARLNQK